MHAPFQFFIADENDVHILHNQLELRIMNKQDHK